MTSDKILRSIQFQDRLRVARTIFIEIPTISGARLWHEGFIESLEKNSAETAYKNLLSPIPHFKPQPRRTTEQVHQPQPIRHNDKSLRHRPPKVTRSLRCRWRSTGTSTRQDQVFLSGGKSLNTKKIVTKETFLF